MNTKRQILYLMVLPVALICNHVYSLILFVFLCIYMGDDYS